MPCDTTNYFLRELTEQEQSLWCPFAFEKVREIGQSSNKLAMRTYEFIKSNQKAKEAITHQLIDLVATSLKKIIEIDEEICDCIHKNNLPIKYKSQLLSLYPDDENRKVQSMMCEHDIDPAEHGRRKRLKLALKKTQEDSPMTSDSPDVDHRQDSDSDDLKQILRQGSEEEEKIQIKIKQEVEEVEEVDLALLDAPTVVFVDNSILRQEQEISLFDEDTNTPPSSQESYVFDVHDYYKKCDEPAQNNTPEAVDVPVEQNPPSPSKTVAPEGKSSANQEGNDCDNGDKTSLSTQNDSDCCIIVDETPTEDAVEIQDETKDHQYDLPTQRITYPIGLEEGPQEGLVESPEAISQKMIAPVNVRISKPDHESNKATASENCGESIEAAKSSEAGTSKAQDEKDEDALLMEGSDGESGKTDDAEALLNSDEDCATSESGESYVGLNDIVMESSPGRQNESKIEKEGNVKDSFMNCLELTDKRTEDQITKTISENNHAPGNSDYGKEGSPKESEKVSEEDFGGLVTVSKVEYCDKYNNISPSKKTMAADHVLDKLLNLQCSEEKSEIRNYTDSDGEVKCEDEVSRSSSSESDSDAESEKNTSSPGGNESYVGLEDLSLDADDLEALASDNSNNVRSRNVKEQASDITASSESSITNEDDITSEIEITDDRDLGVLRCSEKESSSSDVDSYYDGDVSDCTCADDDGSETSHKNETFLQLKDCKVVLSPLKDSLVYEKLLSKRRQHEERSELTEPNLDRLCDLSTLDNATRRKRSRSGSDSGSQSEKAKSKKRLKLKKPSEQEEEDANSAFSSVDSIVSEDDMFADSPTPPVLQSDDETDCEPADPKEMLAEILCDGASDKENESYSSSNDEEDENKKNNKKEKEQNTEHKKKFSEKSAISPKTDKYGKWRNDPLLRHKLNSDSDSDVGPSKTKSPRKKKRRLRVLSDSDFTDVASKHSMSLSSDSSADVLVDLSKRKKRKHRRSDSSSGDVTNLSSDSDKPKLKFSEKTSDSSGLEFVPNDHMTPKKNEQQSEEGTPGSKKGRRNIRKVIADEHLAAATQVARHEEEERIIRLEEKAKVITQITLSQESPSKKVILDFDEATEEAVVSVDSWLSKLMKPHQIEGVKFLWEACFESVEKCNTTKGSGCILAHCMGLGKTFQVIVLIHTLFSQKDLNMKHVLVVCPLSTVKNWHNEFNQWLKKAKYPAHFSVLSLIDKKTDRVETVRRWHRTRGVLIMGYEAYEVLTNEQKILPRSPSKRAKLWEALVDPGPELIICDEGHLLKNGKTLRTQALMNIKTLRRIVLTGTPLQNNLKEYYYMVQFVKPNLLGTYKEYQNAFVSPIENGQYEDSSLRDILLMKKRIHILHKLLKKTIQRVEVSELKTHLDQIWDYAIFVQMSPLQITLYKEFLQLIGSIQRSSGTTQNNKQFLRDYQQLGLICAHPYLLYLRESQRKKRLKEYDTVTDEPDMMTDLKGIPRKWYESLCPSDVKEKLEYGHKYTVMRSIIEEAEMLGDKVLIFSASVVELNALEHFLQEKGTQRCPNWKRNLDYFRMDGTVLPSERSGMCDKFNNQHNTRARVFIMSHRVGGLGLNLVAANRVILMGVNFNPSYDTQSIYRAYRFGQTKPVYVYRLIAMGTMEEKLYQRCITKLAQAGRVVDKYQIDRHYSRNDVSVFYEMVPEFVEDVPTPLVPCDRLMANLLQSSKVIYKYHEHEALLENRPDEALTESEKNSAWEEYNTNRKMEMEAAKRPMGMVPGVPGQANPMQPLSMNGAPLVKQIPVNGTNVRLIGYYPNGFPRFSVVNTSGHLPNGILQMSPELQKQFVEHLLKGMNGQDAIGTLPSLSATIADLPLHFSNYLRELSKRQSTISWSRHSLTSSNVNVVNRNNVPSSDEIIYLSGPSKVAGSGGTDLAEANPPNTPMTYADMPTTCNSSSATYVSSSATYATCSHPNDERPRSQIGNTGAATLMSFAVPHVVVSHSQASNPTLNTFATPSGVRTLSSNGAPTQSGVVSQGMDALNMPTATTALKTMAATASSATSVSAAQPIPGLVFGQGALKFQALPVNEYGQVVLPVSLLAAPPTTTSATCASTTSSGAANMSTVPNASVFQNASGVPNASVFQNAPGIPNAPGVPNALGVPNPSGVQNASLFQNAPGVQNASGVPNASGIQNASVFKNAPGVQNASGVPNASGIQNASVFLNAPGVPNASGVQNVPGVQNASTYQNLPMSHDGPGVRKEQASQNVPVTLNSATNIAGPSSSGSSVGHRAAPRTNATRNLLPQLSTNSFFNKWRYSNAAINTPGPANSTGTKGTTYPSQRFPGSAKSSNPTKGSKHEELIPPSGVGSTKHGQALIPDKQCIDEG